MPKHQPYIEYPAHGKNVEVLHAMIFNLDNNNRDYFRLAPIVVFTAFAIESYINTIGYENISSWNEYERKPWRKKLKLIHEYSGAVLNWEEEPFVFANDVFNVRDKFAHGKPERVLGPVFSSIEDAKSYLANEEMQPNWAKIVNEAWILEIPSKYERFMKHLSGIFENKRCYYKEVSTGGIQQVK